MKQCEKSTQTQHSDTRSVGTSLKERMIRVSCETALEEIIRCCDQDGHLAEDFPKMFVRMVRNIAEIGLRGGRDEA